MALGILKSHKFNIFKVSCDHTVGEALDEGIANAKQDLKDAGRVVSAPFRYVGTKAKEAVENVGEGVGEVLEGAGSSLTSAGRRISGDISAEQAVAASKNRAKVVSVDHTDDNDKVNTVKVAPLHVEKVEPVKVVKPVSAEHVENVKVVKKED